MGERDKGAGRVELSRRDFLKVSAAGAVAAGVGIDLVPTPAMANIALHGTDTGVVNYVTTCPYCSAQCGQVVSVGDHTGDVYDIFGDAKSPTNNGGLCAKGAGSLQLANNRYRIAAFAGAHPEDGSPMAPATGYGYDAGYADGIAYKRIGNQAWTKMDLQVAMSEVAGGDASTDNKHTGLVGARNASVAGGVYTAGMNAAGVQFFGSSHVNNEQNYIYRKLIADFGTSQIEHQARI
ncbi:MAG TPA: twin-arginine translocation signal domain-containing protein [Propionibacteriaceae bacterium]